MESEAKNSYWKDAAKEGVMLGAIFALLSLVTMWLWNSEYEPMKYFLYIFLLFLLKAGVLIAAEIIFLRRYSSKFPDEFPYMQGFTYLLTVMAFTGIIYGAWCAIVEAGIMVDYYMSGLQTSMDNTLAIMAEVPESVMDTFQTASAARPNVFATFLNTIFSMMVGGGIIALFVAAGFKRKRDIFAGNDTEQNQQE